LDAPGPAGIGCAARRAAPAGQRGPRSASYRTGARRAALVPPRPRLGIPSVTGAMPARRRLAHLVVFLIGVGAIAYGQWAWSHERLNQGLFPMLLGIFFVAISASPWLLDPDSP